LICATWMSHVPHTNESCHTHEWVMSHIRMSYVTHMNISDSIDSFVDMCNKPHSKIRLFLKLDPHLSHVWTIPDVDTCNMTHLYKCNMTHSHAGHDSSDMRHDSFWYVQHDSFI